MKKSTQILADFYRRRGAADGMDANHVKLERFITLEYLRGVIKRRDAVIEIGAGVRSYAPELVHMAANVVAVDLFQDNLDRLHKKIKSPNFYTLCADATDLSQIRDGVFDVVFVDGVMSHIDNARDRHRVIATAVRICRPGGIILFNYLTQTPVIVRHGLIKGNIAELTKPRRASDIYTGYFVDDFKKLLAGQPVRHITDISTDGMFEILKEYTNKLSPADFARVRKLQLALCHRPDMIGVASHVISVYKKQGNKK